VVISGLRRHYGLVHLLTGCDGDFGANYLGVISAQTDAAVTDLDEHRAAMLNDLNPSARDQTQFAQAVTMGVDTVDFGDNAFFTRLPATQSTRAHRFLLSTDFVD
jgi:hypothetical protein